MEQFNITAEEMIEGMKQKHSESLENEIKFMISFLRECEKKHLKDKQEESGVKMLQKLIDEQIISSTMFSKLLPIIIDPYYPYELTFTEEQ